MDYDYKKKCGVGAEREKEGDLDAGLRTHGCARC